MSFKAIDISTYQGDVNMKRVRDEAGVQRVILRAGYGKDNTDQKFTRNAEAMINLNVPGGIYWFSYALNTEMAKNEGIFAVRHAKKYWDRCPVAFDFEYDSVNYCRKNGISVTKQLATQFALAFLTEVSNAGFCPVLYLNQDYWSNYFNVDTLKASIPNLKIWYAYWANKLPKTVDIWQYSSKGKVAGINGNVDMDEWFESMEDDYKPAPYVPTTNINIRSFQRAANLDGYSEQVLGEELVEDGIDGPKTQAVRKVILLQAQKNRSGNWVVYSTGECVRWVQKRLTEMGIDCGGVDGYFGAKTRSGVIQYQKTTGLATDGIAGYNTLTRLFYV